MIAITIAACMWVFVSLIAITGAFAEEARTGNLPLLEPFTMTLEATRPRLPEPFTVTIEATRPKLPEPFTVTIEAIRPKLPEPFTVTIEATRPKLPEPFTVTIEATRPRLPEPFTVTIEATRPKLPEPFTVTIEATRPKLPEPFTVTIEATRPPAAAECDQPRKDLVEVKSLADKGSLASARQALDKIKSEQCPELAPQVDAERTRISGLVDNVIKNAEAALDACRFGESRNLLSGLPADPRRAALVDRWNKAYEAEDHARKLVNAAIALRDQGKLTEALTMLREARAAAVCKGSPEAVDKAIADVESGIAEADASKAEAALNACEFTNSRQLIDALPQGPSRTALIERWNKAYEAERRARDLVQEAVALRDQGEPGKAIGMLHRARDLTSCDNTVAAIDKAIAGMESAATASTEDRIAAATASCQRDYGSGYRAGDPLPDGRYYCVPDQATANAKCDQLNKDTGYEAINIKNDGTFGCRMGKIAADNWCRGQRGAGWYAQFNKDRSRVTCSPDGNARTAQCLAQFGVGWRAGDLRADGTWTCYGPRQRATTPRPQPGVRCPPGHIPTESGGCLNLGIFEGLRDPVRGLTR